MVDTRLETSAPGVFGAGNLVHAAETADIAALSGRHAARHIAAALGAGARRPDAARSAGRLSPRGAGRVLVRVEAPLRWISPNAIACAPPPLGRFVLRSQEFRSLLRLEVRQDGRLLARSGPVRLAPGRSAHLGAAWLARVDPAGGPVRVTTGSRQDGRELRFYLVRLSREAPVTTGPEDHRAAARRGPVVLASHADREGAIEALTAAYVAGRLTEEEFEARVGQAFGSRTHTELATIIADIPAPPAARGRPRMPDRVVAAGTAAIIAAAALGGAVLIGGSALIVWAITMTGVLLFTVSVLLNERQQRRSGKRPPRSVPGGQALKGGRPGRIGHDPNATSCVAT